jgi:hypothetical protein
MATMSEPTAVTAARLHFEAVALLVPLDAPVEAYLARLEPLISENRVAFRIIGPADGV